MPRKSGKEKLLNGLCLKNMLELLLQDSSSDFNVSAAIILSSRRCSHGNVPKSTNWIDTILPNFDNNRMRQMLRLEAPEFQHILSLVKEDTAFKNKNSVPQIPVELQLKIALCRFGSSGDSAFIRKVATLFGVGDGGTVITVTDRIISAIVNLKFKFLCWPTREERRKIVANTMLELPGCIGYVDGTEIRLSESPIKDHEFYFSR
ncbi:uncharacterized protein LOC125775544 [Bactrocera dorsalis]|uniref:Uncharacterized protein LOC125775544 n=1 Tax=Bactrocera dorsalis TaxID=27457 RepID=A0A034WS94_BACDO|nr:uncharacterized protein LOC125775544 [Bactrocera dorsalis]